MGIDGTRYLLIAFYLSRRAATRRYTSGYGRAEDVAGVIILASILFSAVYIFWESVQKLFDPQPIKHLPWVAAAVIVGAIGNEIVALFQFRTGRRINSDAMVADGLHARIDGLTSLVVLIAVAGSAAGAPIVDGIVGLLIGVAIVFIAKDATLRIWYRLMDAVDPKNVDQVEGILRQIPGVQDVASVRARWLGHSLVSELVVGVEQGHDAPMVTLKARQQLLEQFPQISLATIETRSQRPPESK